MTPCCGNHHFLCSQVSNFAQTARVVGHTTPRGALNGGALHDKSRAVPRICRRGDAVSRQSRTEEAKKVLIDLSHLTQSTSLRERQPVAPPAV